MDPKCGLTFLCFHQKIFTNSDNFWCCILQCGGGGDSCVCSCESIVWFVALQDIFTSGKHTTEQHFRHCISMDFRFCWLWSNLHFWVYLCFPYDFRLHPQKLRTTFISGEQKHFKVSVGSSYCCGSIILTEYYSFKWQLSNSWRKFTMFTRTLFVDCNSLCTTSMCSTPLHVYHQSSKKK